MLHLRHGGDAPAGAPADPAGDRTLVGVRAPRHHRRRRRARARSWSYTPCTGGMASAARWCMAATDAAASRPDGRLRLWAHGDHPSASALALSLGFERSPGAAADAPLAVRAGPGAGAAGRRRRSARSSRASTTRRGSRSTPAPSPTTRIRAGGRSTTCGYGWPSRGSTRPGSCWPGAAGELLGFHWTKVHGRPHGTTTDHDHDPIGEVYVLGVDPDGARARPGRRADPGRSALPARTRAGPGDAVRRRVQPTRGRALPPATASSAGPPTSASARPLL